MLKENAQRRTIIVISDLHMGGSPPGHPTAADLGTSICSSYKRLTSFIEWVASRGGDTPIELVLAGDVVDFLADDTLEDGRSYSEVWTTCESRAIKKLDRIVQRSRENSDKGPFDALHDLVKNGNRLVILIGNHDVELSLPGVRRHLREYVAPVGGADFEYIFDGEAYTIGDLLIEHGNRYDRFNQIDHSSLRHERSLISRGILTETMTVGTELFQAPPGTLLVIHLMNKLKTKYRFVDLLKPETEAVIPLLLFLEPSCKPLLEAILKLYPAFRSLPSRGLKSPVLTKRAGDTKSRVKPNASSTPTVDELLRKMLGPDSAEFIEQDYDDDSGNMSSSRSTKSAVGRVLDGLADFRFNMSTIMSAIPNTRFHLLRRILLRALNENCFDSSVEAAQYHDAAEELSRHDRFSTVVFGHTHLPKKVPLHGGRATYYNCGTWADIIRLPANLRHEDKRGLDAIEKFVTALRLNSYSEYVTTMTTYVEVTIEGNRVRDSGLYVYCGEQEPRVPFDEYEQRGARCSNGVT